MRLRIACIRALAFVQQPTGFLRVNASAGSTLLLLATIRQMFNNFSSTGTLLDQAEGAYAVPLVGGPEHSF